MNEIQSMNDTWQGGDTDMPPSLVGCGILVDAAFLIPSRKA